MPKQFLKTGFLNIYRSGWFHREGKPGMFDRHPGDIYGTEAAALADIEPKSHYIATVPVSWEDPQDVKINAADSTPVPINVSRKQFAYEQAALEQSAISAA
jgi:hypothetical protein